MEFDRFFFRCCCSTRLFLSRPFNGLFKKKKFTEKNINLRSTDCEFVHDLPTIDYEKRRTNSSFSIDKKNSAIVKLEWFVPLCHCEMKEKSIEIIQKRINYTRNLARSGARASTKCIHRYKHPQTVTEMCAMSHL